MSLLAILLLAVGAADLTGRATWGTERRGPGHDQHLLTPAILTGVAVALLAALLAGLTAPADLALLGWVIVVVVGWVVISGRALTPGATPRQAAWALAVLAVGILGLVAFSGATGPARGPVASWLSWTTVPHVAELDPTRVLLLAGLFLLQLGTGNVLVRLTLTWQGAVVPTASAAGTATGDAHPVGRRLRGGRILGPMERLLILGLGLAGQPTAAGIVVAAKGLIRWPELQAAGRGDPSDGIDELTEYFLIGSFVSWLVALASLALFRLT